MGPLDFLNHLLNFVAPALAVAAVVTLFARVFMRKVPVVQALWVQFAINSGSAVGALALGLVFFGRDAKMASYLAMALVGTTSQWLMLRGWRA